MKFKLGKKSERELIGVHEDLIEVVRRALTYSDVDFAVVDGLRTREEQIDLVERGVSQTMRSKHLKQPDGYGHAVDLVPVINGKIRWEWPAIFQMASAVQQAAQDLEINLRWGGSWTNITQTELLPAEEQEEYIQRKKASGKKPFLDGPHFELIKV